jgi:GNAT superfamily N-acetyltransferase
MIIRQAVLDDVDELLDMRDEAREWLAKLGTDQWSNPWPTLDAMKQRFETSIDADEGWMIEDDGTSVGSVTLDSHCLSDLWLPSECAEPARYVSKMSVRRTHAHQQLGTTILNWAGSQAAEQGALWLRLDAWTTNTTLHQYYLRQGFTHVRTVKTDRPSGALFQRKAAVVPTSFTPG